MHIVVVDSEMMTEGLIATFMCWPAVLSKRLWTLFIEVVALNRAVVRKESLAFIQSRCLQT